MYLQISLLSKKLLHFIAAGRQPSTMTFYCGIYGNSLTDNDASTLNDSSPFVGKVHRWYCIGKCTGRFLGVYVTNSTLGTLDGCLLKVFLKVTGIKESFKHG
jgi:hypothetical protein